MKQLNGMNSFRYCEKFRTNLLTNLKKRFSPLESKELYIHGAVLTTKYGLKGLRAEIQFHKTEFGKSCRKSSNKTSAKRKIKR